MIQPSCKLPKNSSAPQSDPDNSALKIKGEECAEDLEVTPSWDFKEAYPVKTECSDLSLGKFDEREVSQLAGNGTEGNADSKVGNVENHLNPKTTDPSSIQTLHQKKFITKASTSESQPNPDLPHIDASVKGLISKLKKSGSLKLAKKKFSQKSRIRPQGGEKIFRCDSCSATFKRKSNLNCHTLSHTGEKPFKCNYCPIRFAVKSNLVRHFRTHTGEKLFQCDICSVKFAQKDALNSHMLTHTGEKSFNCDVCSARFSLKNSLNRHRRMHTGEKPFQCEACLARFTLKSSLNSHIRAHTGEKPFECEFCSGRFAQKSVLIRHLRTHTGERPFKCDFCSAKFTQKGHLTYHIRTHSGIRT